MNEIKQNTQTGNESDRDFNQNLRNAGEKKMEKIKNQTTGMKINDIDTLLEEDLIPNKSLIDQYNRKKLEAKKLRSRLTRLADEIKVLGDKIKNIGVSND
ncbi:hypothetical protein [Helicobacter sp. 11S03491-1]|uniref:hypothetical protein n=1 Tax=Helicobacter sp. 11S03491-1 TaxID=1476196 RepID=UPI000BA62304|nr:hypothetical protein [Helicobacter sp. 11S03491-1]PAF42170.1 hypothetical protein BKH45_04275 [Helicobacter sp. 11S03491-1]